MYPYLTLGLKGLKLHERHTCILITVNHKPIFKENVKEKAV